MPTKIERDPNDPLLRPDYIRFSWRKSKPPEHGITRKQENEEEQLSQSLFDLAGLKQKTRNKMSII